MSLAKKTCKVEKYYNEWTQRYIDCGYGDVIQAHRPQDLNELLNYIGKNAGIKNGMKILDAGCGICGPAIYFATKFDVNITAVTNSIEQVKIAKSKINEQDLNDRIEIIQGDFHKLDTFLQKENFDLILMLESYGHAINKKMVLAGAQKVLKHEGSLYIKDYFKKEITGSRERKQSMKKFIENMNKYYSYNLPDLNKTIDILRQLDLNLQYVKRNELPIDEQEYVAVFEKKYDIDIFEGRFHYQFVEPLELFFRKLTDIDTPIR
jgi:ubiquinone/menaquinone biosynthesis C-methylase UbiE